MSTGSTCDQCGEPFAAGATVCGSCGRTVAPALGPIHEPPTGSTPVVVLDAPPPLRRRRGIWIGVGAVVVAVAAALAIVLTNDDSSKPAANPGVVPATLPSLAPTDPVVPTTVLERRAVVKQLALIMNRSAQGRAQLSPILTQFRDQCALRGTDAVQKMDAVVTNRTELVVEVATLEAASDRSLVSMVDRLYDALDLSVRSDVLYQRWMQENSATDASSPCQRRETNNKVEGDNYSQSATEEKTAFVGQYNPLATRAGERSNWTVNDF